MNTANIAILKNNLSRFLRTVQEGGDVIVMDRNRPVARLVPFREAPRRSERASQTDDGRVETLVQRGALTHRGDARATAAWAKSLKPSKRPKGIPALSDVFLQMRDEERW